jgi:glucosamine--fructose-6-phosphate aminotransferase (isomerizing)
MMAEVRTDARAVEPPPTWGTPYDLDAVRNQSRLIRPVIERVDPQVRKVISTELAKSVDKVVMTGCGDSHYAGVAARLAFDLYSGVPTEPMESLEFSRYGVDFAPPTTLVLGISNSGAVSRTIETLVRSGKRKLHTVAITGSADSALAKAGEQTIIQTVSEMVREERSPFAAGVPYGAGSLGLGNFAASLLTLYLIAFRLGEVRGKITEADGKRLRETLIGYESVLDRTAAANEATAKELADRFWNLDAFYILGGGPNYASALFSAAKLFEQPNLNGVPIELEEWAHEQYFLTRPGTPVFVICPPGRSHDRALEQIRGAKDMGGTVIGVCEEGDDAVRSSVDHALLVAGRVAEEFSPLAYVIPPMLVATALHQLRGRPPLVAAFSQEKMMQVNFRQIFHSEIS